VDLAVFNRDGRVQIGKDQPEPPILLPPGWLKRLKRAKKQFFDDTQKHGSLGFGRLAPVTAPEISDDFVRYPVERVGRLEKNTATALLAAWATFQTRAALEHDFAQVKPLERRSAVSVPDAEAIRRRAYEISEERRRTGQIPDPVADWYQAEQEIAQRDS
jgi:Protein of unknown function (DUF2934)